MTTRGIVLIFGYVVVELLPGMSEWLVGSGCLLWCPCSPGLSGAPSAPQFFSCSPRREGIILCILRLWLGDGNLWGGSSQERGIVGCQWVWCRGQRG